MTYFKVGDRVQLTDKGIACELVSNASARVGTFLGPGKVRPDLIRIKQDGLVQVGVWHPSFWELYSDSDSGDSGDNAVEVN